MAEQRGWSVVAEHVDNSISASNKHRERPGYDRLVAAYDVGEFEALICWDLDRLTRQPRQLEDWIDRATDRGLLLVTANGEADLSTDAGRQFARIKASVGRNEVERKSARQRRAALQRAESGRPPLGVRLTGYAVDGSLIDYEAAFIRRMFERFAVGDSLRSIAAWLTETSVPTRQGSPSWHPSTVRGALMNPRYADRGVYQGKENGKPGAWDAIADDDLFTEVQARLSDPRRKTNRYGHDRKHLGSGLYECGVCERRIYAWSGNRYRCREGCLTRAQRGIDDFVLRVIRERLGRPDDLATLIAPETSEEVRRIGDEAKRLRSRLSQIDDDYDAGRIDGRRYAVASEKVRAELSRTEVTQARLAIGSAAASTLFAPTLLRHSTPLP